MVGNGLDAALPIQVPNLDQALSTGSHQPIKCAGQIRRRCLNTTSQTRTDEANISNGTTVTQ